jgi:hypothetical protein
VTWKPYGDLGATSRLQVRWFDAELNESPEPDAPGRWLAWIEGTAPNGTPMRRSRTFYALPKQLPSNFSPDLTVAFPHFPGPEAPVVLQEHESEIVRVANDALVRAVLGSEQGAVLVAGLTEAEPLGRPARYVESTSVRNDDCHLALKLKLQGCRTKCGHCVRPDTGINLLPCSTLVRPPRLAWLLMPRPNRRCVPLLG